MSDLLANLWLGFHVAANPFNILFCLLGALVGTLVGVLPGIGSVATIAMLLPITFGLPPVGALIMLAGIYYGAQYGGSTTSVLVNIPGEATSVITCLDGHQMARQGRAGPERGAGEARAHRQHEIGFRHELGEHLRPRARGRPERERMAFGNGALARIGGDHRRGNELGQSA